MEQYHLPSWVYNQNRNNYRKQKDIYVQARPLIKTFTPYQKFVDDFQFPPIEKARRLPLKEADFEIDKRAYRQSNNPKSIYITTDGVFASNEDNQYLPNLRTQSQLGWSGILRGDLERIQPPKRLPLKYLGSEVVYNEWKPIPRDELALGPRFKMTQAEMDKADEAVEQAFDKVDFRKYGYKTIDEINGGSKGDMSSKMAELEARFARNEDQVQNSEVQKWLESLRK